MSVEVDRRLFLAADGKTLVEDGDPSAAFLWSSAGKQVSDAEAERVGYKAKAAPTADKAKRAPANKSRSKKAD